MSCLYSSVQVRRWSPVLTMALLLLSMGTMTSGCAIWSPAAAPSDGAARAETMPTVDAAVVTAGALEPDSAYTGTTQATQLVSLRSRVDGQVTALMADVGDPVAAGDGVVRLDADLLTVDLNQAQAELRARQSEVAQAQAAVSDAQTVLAAAKVELQQAQTEANRLTQLANNGAISIQAAEQARLTVDTGQQVLNSAAEQIRTRQEAVNAALGRVRAQQAVVAQAQERLSYALVRSPLDGTVIERSVEVGDYAETGDALMQVGDLSQIQINIDVSDRDLGDISLGQPITARLDAFPEQAISGRITRIAPAADPTSRLIPVEIVIPNVNRRIGTGLLARVSLEGPERGDRVAIPKGALELAAESADPTVFVVGDRTGDEALVQARTLELGEATSDRVQVLAGLSPGETVVLRSSAPLTDGQTVKLSILSAPQPSAE